MAFIRRSNGGLMEVDNPNEYKGKAVWDNSEESSSVDKNINSLKLTASKYYQTGSKKTKNLLKPSLSAKEIENNSMRESPGKSSSGKATNSWKLGFKNFKKLFKFNKSKGSKLEAELEAKMKIAEETKDIHKKSLPAQLLANLYTLLTSIIQSINFSTVFSLVATFMLLSLVYHLYHDFDKLYNEHIENNLIEIEKAKLHLNTYCKKLDFGNPDIDEESKEDCYQAKVGASSNYLIVNKTKIWVELIGGLINHFFNSLSLKTLIILVGLIVLGSVLTNLSSILNIRNNRGRDDEPREVRHVLYFENYQNNQGQIGSQMRSISQDSSSLSGRAIEAGNASSSNLVPLSSY